jgi:hypothetical protein
MKSKAITVSILLILAWAAFTTTLTAQTKGMKQVKAKKGVLHLNQKVKAGDVTLKSGSYQVRLVMEGDEHFIVFRIIPSGQGYRGGNTLPGKEVARIKCQHEPVAKKWNNTTVTLRTNAAGKKEIAEIHVAGEAFIHRL